VEEYRNLKEPALPFESIALSVHDQSDDLQAKEIFSRLPLRWTRAYNLTRREEILSPFNWFFTINEFNGPSAGNCVEEALSQGICEIVERHVSSVISRQKLKTAAVNNSVGMFSAKLMAESGDPEWAIHELKKLDESMPGKYYTKFFLGTTYLSTNYTNKALKYLEEALNLDPDKEDIPSIYSYMGYCFKGLERYSEAIAVLEKAESYDADRTDLYNLMGFCYFKLKEHEKAIQCFRKVLQLDPSSAIDYANIASNYRDMGNKVNAVRYYEFALELDPTIDFARESLNKLREKVR